jgi:hypothetical protein
MPEDQECVRVESGDETLYVCDGVLYRPTYYGDELVYEIVSDEGDAPIAVGSGSVEGLRLTSPLTTGAEVRALQNALVDAGYDVGGVVDAATATALGF